MRTVPDGTDANLGLGKPIRPEPKPPEDVITEVKPGIWSVNGKLQPNKPTKPIDWESLGEAIEIWAADMHQDCDIVILDGGVLKIARDPEFPRDEFGSM